MSNFMRILHKETTDFICKNRTKFSGFQVDL